MTQKEIIKIAIKYIKVANALDNAGLTKEAEKIDAEILFAIKNKILPIKIKNIKTASNFKNTRTAIVGQSDWNDYLENIATGAGGAAGWAAGSGAWAAIPVATALGGGLGAASTFGRDIMFNKLQGPTSQLETLNAGLIKSVSNLTNIIKNYDPVTAQQILYLYGILNKKIKSIREQKRKEISEQVGLDPNKGFLQSINPGNWGKVLNRSWQMIKSNNINDMTKIATSLDDTGIISMLSDPSYKGGTAALKAKGLQGGVGLLPMIGIMGGSWAGKSGYNLIANKIKGQANIFRKHISDIQKYGMAITKAMQDPSAIEITNSIAELSSKTLQAILSEQNPIKQELNIKNQTGTPIDSSIPTAQYWKSNQSFK